MHKTLIFIPTYNEAENVEVLFRQIRELHLNIDILFLDDNSPDGTGRIIDRIAQEQPNVYAIHRTGKLGIGSAHQEGIAWAYERGYTTLITMDCDFSHSPAYLSEFVSYAPTFDVVVGSRYMEKNSLPGWNLYRRILTYLGHFLTDRILNMPYDATGAFRLYRLDRIEQGVFSLVDSKGYSFFFESLYILHLNKFTIKEFPIQLPARTYGHSKMTMRGAFNSLQQLGRIYRRTLKDRNSLIYQRKPAEIVSASKVADLASDAHPNAGQVEEDWNQYWKKEQKSVNIVYHQIAVFYRLFIIKRTLNYFIKRYFAKGAHILHAGCGGGQVDTDVTCWANVSALDISKPALALYQKTNPNVRVIIHGDIFRIPTENETYDGVYNLGVMEHFTEDEIQKILQEFKRVLKPGGRLVIFWPPEFGVTTNFLKMVHFFIQKVLKKNIKLHPDEITRIRSKKHMIGIFEKAGFQPLQYYFGIKDFFTHSIIIVQKQPTDERREK